MLLRTLAGAGRGAGVMGSLRCRTKTGTSNSSTANNAALGDADEEAIRSLSHRLRTQLSATRGPSPPAETVPSDTAVAPPVGVAVALISDSDQPVGSFGGLISTSIPRCSCSSA